MALEAEILWQHHLVPRHYICSDEETEEVLERWNVKKEQLPRILITDPAVKALKAPVGSLIKVERPSQTAGLHYAYRLVVEE